MIGFIYIIKNTVNSKVYIGQTHNSIEQRWKEHVRHSQYGEQVINKAMKKYGVEKFYIEKLEVCSVDVLDEREIYYIDLFNSTDKSCGYNVSIGGKTPKFKRKALNIKEVIDLYVTNFFSIEKIAEKFNTTVWIVRMELKNAGITIRNRHDSARRIDKINKDIIIEALQNTTSLRQAAKYANVPYATFRSACIYNHIEYNSSKSARH